MAEGPFSVPLVICVNAPGARIEGDFETDLPDEFLNLNDFAELVFYIPGDGGDQLPVKAMYDAESTEVDPDTGDMRSTNPLLTIATKTAPDVTNKDSFSIFNNTFRVRTVMPDGSGLTVIELTKDQ